ncbi:alpha/beta hydrolase [Nocardia sp. NPDC005746]|uniref:alpha/beta fold hydrolase n=1 Tax=Nocardia sp. NPDC005746 TaxID=3157062 RepID=UPI0033CA5AA6
MTASRTTPILFLSGAGLPAWIWDDVRNSLHVESVVATYPRRADATLRDYADAVLEQTPGRVFTIVAHSIGGVVASEIAAIAPERLDGILGVAASMPGIGKSFLGAMPTPQKLVMGLIMRFAGTKPPENAIRSGVCAGLGEADTSRIVSQFEPESQHLYRDGVSARTFPARRGYVVTSSDRVIPAADQRRHATELGAEFRSELSTGHLPMLQDPASLARIVGEFKTES